MKCDQCGKPMSVSMMSMWSMDLLCMDCKAKEVKKAFVQKIVNTDRKLISEKNK